MPSICRYQQTDDSDGRDRFDENAELVCDVGSDGILRHDDRIELHFHLDTDVLTVPSLNISVRVESASDERNLVDNRHMLELAVLERSAIEVVG